MTPEAFIDWARLFPEPLFLVTGAGKVLAGNESDGRLVGLSRAALAGRALGDLVTTPRAQVDAYLRACTRTRTLLPGGLTFRGPGGAQTVCRAEGAVLRPRTGQTAAVFLLRCRPRAETVQPFTQLNQRLQTLSTAHRQLGQSATRSSVRAATPRSYTSPSRLPPCSRWRGGLCCRRARR